MSELAILSALETDPDEVFRTEVLCQWVKALDVAINPGAWRDLADPDAPRRDGVVFVLDVAPDHSTASIAVAWRRDDGASQVMLADHRDGVDWVPGRAAELTASWGGDVVVEQTGTAGFLIPALERAGATVDPVPRRAYVEACASLDAAVASRTLMHGNQGSLNAAVAVARWSTGGNAGQRVLSRRDPAVSPLVAAAMAAHALEAPAALGGWLVGLP